MAGNAYPVGGSGGIMSDVFTSAFEGERRIKTAVDPDLKDRLLKNLDAFDQSLSVEYTPMVELTSIYGVSILRDVTNLTGATFTDPANHSETATQYDVSATAMTGGEQIFIDLSAGGAGNRTTLTTLDLPQIDIPTGATVTLAARTVSNTGAATVSTVFKDRQEW